MVRRIALGVAVSMIAVFASGCVEPPEITQSPSPTTVPSSVTPIGTPSVDSSEDHPNDDGLDDDSLIPEELDLSELSVAGVSEDQIWTAETNLYSVFYGFNSDEPDPDKYEKSIWVGDVVRQKTKGGGWVYNARLYTNVGEHELQITVPDSSSDWGMKIVVDGEETL